MRFQVESVIMIASHNSCRSQHIAVFIENRQNMYSSEKGRTIPLSTIAGIVSAVKQFCARYKGYLVTKSAYHSGNSVQPIPDEYRINSILQENLQDDE
jgi:hypothetical protein